MSGKVTSRRERRPKRSIVRKPGYANSQLSAPKPTDAPIAETSLKPALEKTLDE
jgi:hypothetical protein